MTNRRPTRSPTGAVLTFAITFTEPTDKRFLSFGTPRTVEALDIHANRQPPALVPVITFWPQKSRRARNLTVLLWLSVGGVGVSVVLVSNRAVSSRANGPVEGGLASALLQAVKH